ncbi:3-galactosyl-N-acetylglucosaminide 4-alpha-L-fucosyltransferase FUT3 isoform X1 [Hydra vulgaris]|uniref:3-galactosyl-N-acetylglucosaminide 4-alpha-L-fucosyltransferase FUT3 isoform X1 n=1 Tax=Hydra vulgaris TaxID=6087 RepID=UPI001F5F7426|nr:3-galactosyl-N-acetylglucosaminide 4-alpha-L-fucosyltransferase FUT3 [Hydra vulgaris]
MEIFQWKTFFIFCCFSIPFFIYIYFNFTTFIKYGILNPSFANVVKQATKDSKNYRIFNLENKQKTEKSLYLNQKILLLLYTSFFGDKWPIDSSSKCNFETSNFQMTYNKDLFRRSDVVMFHSRNMPSIQELESLSNIRSKEQLWIYFTMESIYNNPSVDNIDRYFNATASYGTDTDIPLPYRYHGKLLKTDESIDKDYFSKKSKMVAWMVSNCNGDARNKLASKLISFGVDIEVLGSCSINFPKQFSSKCPGKPCLDDFKFYYSAENSLCDGYITEKYWYNGLDNNLIPIVLGGSNYSDPRLAIPGSFIDAMSFDSPKALADYILDVSSNSTKYNSYFRWKKNWQLDSSSNFCMLCDKIRNGLNLRKNPLIKTMHIEKCIRPQEKFNIWINNN